MLQTLKFSTIFKYLDGLKCKYSPQKEFILIKVHAMKQRERESNIAQYPKCCFLRIHFYLARCNVNTLFLAYLSTPE